MKDFLRIVKGKTTATLEFYVQWTVHQTQRQNKDFCRQTQLIEFNLDRATL